MRLRSRISLALLATVVILVAPAVYGLATLWELRQIVQDLRTRDAVGALALGRLQTAVGEVEHWQRIYLALAGEPPATRADHRRRVETNMERVEEELNTLAGAGYVIETGPARRQWEQLQEMIAREQALVEAGDIAEAGRFRVQEVNPAFTAMDRTLDPIGAAINRAGEEQVQRAEALAAGAATTTLLALAFAMLIVLVIAHLLTRSIVRPIDDLRLGMATVAAGDFDPELRTNLERPDELGDLARSFERMTEQLAELDRLKAEFLSIASHEIKTPISVVKGYISLLQEGIYGEVDERQRKVLGSVSDQTDRLARMVQQLLDLSRFEAGGGRLEIQPIDFQAFLEELVTSFEVLAIQNDIDFRLEVADGVPHSVQGDPDRLNEVIGNLLSNAFKFTPRGGEIRLRAAHSDGGAVVEVSDNGIGIPEENLAYIFDKFYQVENEAQPKSVGSGLGLAIAREIVEAHGGTIGAESRLGEGTTFRVFLPEQPTVASN